MLDKLKNGFYKRAKKNGSDDPFELKCNAVTED